MFHSLTILNVQYFGPTVVGQTKITGLSPQVPNLFAPDEVEQVDLPESQVGFVGFYPGNCIYDMFFSQDEVDHGRSSSLANMKNRLLFYVIYISNWSFNHEGIHQFQSDS